MVKQGKFASSTRSVHGKTQRYKAVSGAAKITRDDAPEFMMVRYHLTRGKKQSDLVEKTMLRLLDAFVPMLLTNDGDIDNTLTEHMKLASIQVPWQYYKVVTDEWTPFMKWVKKEFLAMPLIEQVLLKNVDVDVHALVGHQLAINWWLMQSGGNAQRLATVTPDKITSLATTFLPNGQIDWTVVATIYSTVQYTPDTAFDEETVTWLNGLNELH
ncbi:hypothetical protein [Weissella ceti]|uniref:hypothetical protein n=1 Tax=Weissella ceti TaxID=759620 RepID=UPI001BD05A29|nr:hypothetical protein [Weissella ceti]QVK12117.1 hypothetical protein KHQ31_00090 [Weissella ceti]